MNMMQEKIIELLREENDEKLLNEMIKYYEFLKWKKLNNNEDDLEEEEPEIEIQWYL